MDAAGGLPMLKNLLDHKLLQVGGDATTGRGLLTFKILEG